MMSFTEDLSDWALNLEYQELPENVISNTRLRVLDVIGLTLAGLGTAFGQSVRLSTTQLAPGGCSHILGCGDATTVSGAAFANGALSQALEFDDTHNLSIVHMSSPSVATALALAERDGHCGRDLITAIAVGNEISCRLGSVAPGQFHRRGYHPTGLFATFGTTWLAGRLLGLDRQQMTNAAGIAGSFASGLLQCWVDGTQSKFLHPGWAAQSGITAATLARNGTTGPEAVIEGRFGMFASHLQDDTVTLDYAMLSDDLGCRWESENASFKPFPAAHVIHPYIDALLGLKKTHNINPLDVESIVCPVPEYIVGIVCEPSSEKKRPLSDSHARVSLQYCLAEALVLGHIDKNAFAPESLSNPDILRIADLVDYRVDSNFPGPEQFKGQVHITLHDGQSFTEVEEYNRGSAENPMPVEDLIAKFNDNVAEILTPEQSQILIDTVLSLDELADAAQIIGLTVGDKRC